MRNFALIALVLGLVACRDSGGGDDTGTPDGNTNTEDVTIQEIQDPAMPACSPATPQGCVEIKLKGVVVTAIDAFGSRTGENFWVQEPGGGAFSGVQVYGAPLDQIAALQVGDVVDISGAQKEEYAFDPVDGPPLPPEQRMTELAPLDGGMMTVTKTGAQMQIEPVVVNALEIGQMTDFMARHAEWEKWEGVLVKLENVQAFRDQECITSKGVCNDMTYQRFDVTGDIVVQSSLAAMPTPKVSSGDCFSSVTGVVGYFYDYNLQPRTSAEFATGGNACPLENQAAVCADSIDNDGNGFKDCGDNSCILPEPTCRPETAINAIKTATTAPLGVEVKDAIVAGISFNKRNLWVQTNLQAGTNEGIYVRGPGADLSTFAVGSRVNIIGRVSEFGNATDSLTQIQGLAITAGTAGTGTVLPVANQSAATLLVNASGEPMESSLVELKNVRVTALGTSTNNYIATLTQNGTAFKADDDIYRLATADLNDCFSSLIGFWSWNGYDNHWVFVPRKATATNAPDGTLAANQTDCN